MTLRNNIMTSPSGVQWEVFRSGPDDSIVIRLSIGLGEKRISVARAYCPRILRSFEGDIEAIIADCAKSLTGFRPAENDELILQAAQAVRIEWMLMPAKGRSMSHPTRRRAT